MTADERHMRMALRLATRGGRAVEPNPQVGAVLVRDGIVVGRGWHRHAGGAHAEVEALRDAGERARGATMYVTLEPCNHTGRTPPCTEALIAAGISEVVIGARDPNPSVRGGGMERLRAAGIPCRTGVLQDPCRELLAPFTVWTTKKRPFVFLKMALSLDGVLAPERGSSQWITGLEARTKAHELRAESDVIIIGSGTLLADNPSLTVRAGRGRSPARLVISSTLDVPLHAAMFSDGAAPVTLAVPSVAVRRHPEAAGRITRMGIEVLPCRLERRRTISGNPHVSISALLSGLFDRGVRIVMVEGGAGIHASMLSAGCVDRLDVYTAPLVIGSGLRPFDAVTSGTLAGAIRWRLASATPVGNDLHLRLYPISQEG